MVELFLYKQEVLEWLLTVWLEEVVKDSKVKDVIRTKMETHASYRQGVCAYPAEPTPDLSWKMGWPASVRKAVELIEEIVFKMSYNSSLKAGMKNMKLPRDLLHSSQPLSEVLSDIDKLQKEELARAKEAAGSCIDEDAPKESIAEPDAGEEINKAIAFTITSQSSSMPLQVDDPEMKFVQQAMGKTSNVILRGPCKSPDEVLSVLKECGHFLKSLPGNTAIIWDQTAAGEAASRPHVRNPPFQKKSYEMYTTGYMRFRSDAPDNLAFDKKDVYMFADGGRKGIAARAAKVLAAPPTKTANSEIIKQRKDVTIGYELDSLVSMKKKVRGLVPQMEGCFFAGQAIAEVPTKKRRFFAQASSTNKGNLLAPVSVPSLKDCFAGTFKTKREAFGEYRLLVGGKDGNDDNDEANNEEDVEMDDEVPWSVGELETGGKKRKRTQRDDDQLEPMFYHGHKCEKLWQELLHSANVKKAVAFTPGDGAILHACMIDEIPVVAFVFTEKMKQLLQD